MDDDGTPPLDGEREAIGYPLSQMGWDLYERYFLIENVDKAPTEEDGEQPWTPGTPLYWNGPQA
jgi:hypothetical protein